MAEEVKTKYYPINEEAARHAKEAYSFDSYESGSATKEYRQSVDNAVKIATRQKARVDPIYHNKIDLLLDLYARKLADNTNQRFLIDAHVPSVLIAGPSNFPVRQKEKQNASRDRNLKEWKEIQGLLDKITSTGLGGISSDHPDAIQKLEEKVTRLEQLQETMKAVNAYYRKNQTLEGCSFLPLESIEKLEAAMSQNWRSAPKPFETYSLTNNNAEIHRLKSRISELKQRDETGYIGWEFVGGRVEANQQNNRLQVFFNEIPADEIRSELKSHGFKWAPSAKAWQRQLNNNAVYAAKHMECTHPLDCPAPQKEASDSFDEGEKPHKQEEPVR